MNRKTVKGLFYAGFGGIYRLRGCTGRRIWSFSRQRLPIPSRSAILLTTVSEHVIACLNACPGTIAAEAARRRAVKAHRAITLRDNDPTIFNLESRGGIISPRHSAH